MIVFLVRLFFISMLVYIFKNNFFGFIGFNYWYLEVLLFALMFLAGDFLITRYLVKRL